MQARALVALLENIPEDIEVYIDLGDYELPVGTIIYDDQHGTLSLLPIDDEDYADSPEDYTDHDDDEAPTKEKNICAIPERQVPENVKDL
jgi:hypothetical protein